MFCPNVQTARYLTPYSNNVIILIMFVCIRLVEFVEEFYVGLRLEVMGFQVSNGNRIRRFKTII